MHHPHRVTDAIVYTGEPFARVKHDVAEMLRTKDVLVAQSESAVVTKDGTGIVMVTRTRKGDEFNHMISIFVNCLITLEI